MMGEGFGPASGPGYATSPGDIGASLMVTGKKVASVWGEGAANFCFQGTISNFVYGRAVEHLRRHSFDEPLAEDDGELSLCH